MATYSDLMPCCSEGWLPVGYWYNWYTISKESKPRASARNSYTSCLRQWRRDDIKLWKVHSCNSHDIWDDYMVPVELSAERWSVRSWSQNLRTTALSAIEHLRTPQECRQLNTINSYLRYVTLHCCTSPFTWNALEVRYVTPRHTSVHTTCACYDVLCVTFSTTYVRAFQKRTKRYGSKSL